MNVLFLDDDKATNFFNKRLAKSSDLFKHIQTRQDAKKVLDCLKTDLECSDDYIKPHIIFLDINMPGMNGWEFLEKFYKLSDGAKKNVKIVMLSTSSEEEKVAAMNKEQTIIGYLKKPLKKDVFQNILSKYKNASLG